MVKITIFGLPGTGTSTVAKMLADRNEFKHKSSGEIFRNMAEEKGVSVEKLNEMSENDKSIDKEIDDKIKEFGKENDDFVLDSRLAWYFIPDSVKIKLECKDQIRYDRIADRDKISLFQAREKTSSREETEKRKFREHYGIEDFTNNNYFHIIIDSSNIEPEKICQTIEDFLDKFVKK